MNPLDPIHISLSGTKLIEASAGTGKTYAITSLYVRLVVERQLEVEKILVVTFTEAATRELRERVRLRLLDALTAYDSGGGDPFLVDLVEKHTREGLDLDKCRQRLQLALQSIDLAAIYTIHGFCARILRDCAFESGFLFDLEVAEDDSDLLGQIIDDYWRIHSGDWHPVLTGYLFKQRVNADTLFHEMQIPIRVSRASGMAAVDLPPADDPAGFTPPLEQLAAIWCREKETIGELLGSPALSAAKTAYSAANKAKWQREIDSYFASGYSGMMPLEAFSFLAQGSLIRLTKKTKIGQTPEHDFFLLADQLVDSLERAYHGIRRQLIEYCLSEMPLRKSTLGTLSFDDLLFGVRDALANQQTGSLFAAKVKNRYPAVLIDEFQDTDQVQYSIFQTIYGNQDNFLFLLGDPKQAIYRFRGADIYAYLQAVTAAGDEVYNLDTNWRSESGLITAVNLLFGQEFGQRPFLLPEIAYSPIKVPERRAPVLSLEEGDLAPLSFLLFPEQDNRDDTKKIVARDLAARIRQFIALGQQGRAGYCLSKDGNAGCQDEEGAARSLKAGDIAVLVRNHRDAEVIRCALYQAGVRSVVHSRHNVFDTIEARELQMVLAAVMQPGQGRTLKAALATTILGWSAERILVLEEDEKGWEEVVDRFLLYHKSWLAKGFATMMHGLFRQEVVFPRLASFEQGERRLTNLRHLVEILHGKGEGENLGMASLLEWFHHQRHDGRASQETELRLESDESLVKIVTIHKSKGLEYSVVCCPFLWDSSFLNPKKKNCVPWHDASGNERLDLGTSEIEKRRLLQEMETMAEEIRLLYVAVTRAKSRCLVHWGRVLSRKRSVTASSALHYLLHRPETIHGGIVKTMEQCEKDLSEAELLAPLYRMAEISPESVSVQRVACVPPATVEAFAKISLDPVPIFSGSLLPSWQIRSFSGLQFHEHKALEEPDHDGLTESSQRDTGDESGVQGESVTDTKMTFFDFPRGAQAGSCLHDMLERLDSEGIHSPDAAALVRTSLTTFGIAEEWLPVVLQALANILETPLDTKQAGLSLAALPKEKRLVELEFYYSLPALSSQELLAVFRGRGLRYPGRMQQEKLAGAEAVPGFMKGFIDLIFEWHGRYYIVDYKSNYLGRGVEEYHQSRLQEEIVTAGYDLQYHIYLVALHRYLGSRLADYDYDSHIGGVYYLFLRGMSPEVGPDCGVFYDRPDREVVEGIDRLLEI